MSVDKCLFRLVDTGKIDRRTAEEARALWRRYQGRFSLDMPPAEAEVAAALAAARELTQSTKEKRRSVALQVIRQTEAERVQMADPRGPAAGGMSILTRDIYRRGGENVDTRANTLRETFFAKFDHGIEAYKSTMAGLKQNVAGPQNMVRELFGVDTGDTVAKAAAAGWRDAVEYGTAYVRRAGKVFESMEDWRLPQFWAPDRVRGFGAAEFKADLQRAVDSGALRLFDKESMDFATDPERISALLDKAARDIITEAGDAPVFSKEMRTFHFQEGRAGAEAWIELQGKYGAGRDIIGVLTGHLGSMAREAALVDILGPQHEATARLLAKNARSWERQGRPGGSWLRPIGLESARAIERTYDVLTGRANQVESRFWASALAATRSLVTASSLGSAVVSAVPGDSVTVTLAAHYNGMSGFDVIGRAIGTLTAKDPVAREAAARMLVTGHAMSDHALGTVRYTDQLTGPKLAQRVADTVIRASGLTAWTEHLKSAFTMEFLGFVAGQAGKSREALDAPFRAFLDRYRISASEWDALRARPMQDIHGAKYFDSSAAAEDAAVRKLYEGIIQERALAVLEPDARVRQLTSNLGGPAGTFIGEVARSATMFTSFAQTMVATHMMALAVKGGTPGNRALNAVAFIGLHLAAGALILQARQILKGSDPIGMDQPKFWLQAFAQGGGLGYYGDLVVKVAEASDRSIAGQLSGPVLGLAEDAIRAGKALGEGRGPGKAIDVLKRVTPGSNLWFARLAIDRLLFDQLHRALNPDYAQTFQRRADRQMKAYGQESFWSPGETAPRRAPDLGAMLGR